MSIKTWNGDLNLGGINELMDNFNYRIYYTLW